MNKRHYWIWWIVGLALNAWLTLALARAIDFPIWIVVIFLFVMEMAPALWTWGCIRRTRFVTQDLIGGFWVLMQMIVFVFVIVALGSVPILSTDWGIVLKIVMIPLSAVFMYFRSRSTVGLIRSRGI